MINNIDYIDTEYVDIYVRIVITNKREYVYYCNDQVFKEFNPFCFFI